MLPDISWLLDYRFILTLIWKLLIITQNTSSIGSKQFTDFRDRYPTPRFLPTETNITRTVGETALLNCSIVNLGTRTVVWRKIDNISILTVGTLTFVKDSTVTVEHKPGQPDWNLKIINVTMEHTGTYECQVSTKEKNFRKNFYLKIKERKAESRKQLKQGISLTGPDHVNKDSKLSLTCNATGVDAPPDDLDWFRNGFKLVTNFDEGVLMDKTVRLSTKTIASTLHITRAKMKDSGTYTCRTSDLQVKSKGVQVLTAESDHEKRREKINKKASHSVTVKSSDFNKSTTLTQTSLFLLLFLLIHQSVQKTLTS